MVKLQITRGELVEILTGKLADNSRNSRWLPDGEVSSENYCSCEMSKVSLNWCHIFH